MASGQAYIQYGLFLVNLGASAYATVHFFFIACMVDLRFFWFVLSHNLNSYFCWKEPEKWENTIYSIHTNLHLVDQVKNHELRAMILSVKELRKRIKGANAKVKDTNCNLQNFAWRIWPKSFIICFKLALFSAQSAPRAIPWFYSSSATVYGHHIMW